MNANTLALMAQGFGNALDPMNLLMMVIGVTIGVIVGCMPGLSAAMGVALLLPLTFGMKAETGLIMLGGIYCGAIFGGSICAILIHTPGTPASAATAMSSPNRDARAKRSAPPAPLLSSAGFSPAFPSTSSHRSLQSLR